MTPYSTLRRDAAHRGASRKALITGLVAMVMALIPATTAGQSPGKGPSLLRPRGPGLIMPTLNPARGRRLFAARGCVICHSVNGVGGTIGPSLDAAAATPYASPFEFAARMWKGAEAMIALQAEELGYQIELDGETLGDITAFAHDRGEQLKFSESDIPRDILLMMKMRKL